MESSLEDLIEYMITFQTSTSQRGQMAEFAARAKTFMNKQKFREAKVTLEAAIKMATRSDMAALLECLCAYLQLVTFCDAEFEIPTAVLCFFAIALQLIDVDDVENAVKLLYNLEDAFNSNKLCEEEQKELQDFLKELLFTKNSGVGARIVLELKQCPLVDDVLRDINQQLLDSTDPSVAGLILSDDPNTIRDVYLDGAQLEDLVPHF